MPVLSLQKTLPVKILSFILISWLCWWPTASQATNGTVINDLRYQTLEGKLGRLSDFKKYPALTIVVRAGNCGIAEKLGPRIAQLEKDYRGKIPFLFVYAGKLDMTTAAKKDKKDFGFQGDYFIDDEAIFIDALNAKTTTQVFVLDPERHVLYSGAVDDQFLLFKSKEHVMQNHLRNTLEAITLGRPVPNKTTDAPGCLLTRKSAADRETNLVFKDVRGLFETKCQNCHDGKGSSAFRLTSYDEIAAQKDMVLYVLKKKMMPPWFVDPSTGPWRNNFSMDEGDRAKLVEWLEGGAIKGPPEKNVKKFVSEFAMGPADLVIRIPKKVSIPADGQIPLQYFTIKNPLKEGRWISAYEIIPKAGSVHHVAFYELEDPKGSHDFSKNSNTEFIWGAGGGPMFFGDDGGVYLKPGVTLGAEVHYHATGRALVDNRETRIGFRFHKKKPLHETKYIKLMHSGELTLPPGAANVKLTDTYPITENFKLLGVAVHLHQRGKTVDMRVLSPEGVDKDLFKLNYYNEHFQYFYRYAEPPVLKAGSKLSCDVVYDNSAANPYNPDPTATVTWGLSSTDEMFKCIFMGYAE